MVTIESHITVEPGDEVLLPGQHVLKVKAHRYLGREDAHLSAVMQYAACTAVAIPLSGDPIYIPNTQDAHTIRFGGVTGADGDIQQAFFIINHVTFENGAARHA